jgi:L-histidine Nalpha-methyltransferase
MMSADYTEKILNDRFSIFNLDGFKNISSFADDAYNGLTSDPKTLPPKYFYDIKGSELFEKICLTPEYYVTRTEASILKKYSSEIAAGNRDKKVIVELGSGSSIKTRYIIDAFIRQNGPVTYVPIDVSEILIESGNSLLNDFEGLSVNGILGEYEESIEAAGKIFDEPKLIVFLGSSIGNFDLPHAGEFLKTISSHMKSDDSLLIGFDMVKDTETLKRAYNDSLGVTADFNKNILKRINAELDGGFDLNKFSHKAIFNENESRMEMHLVSKEDQQVKLNGSCVVDFQKGESIHTENSYKFTHKMIQDLAANAELKVKKVWNDDLDYFSLTLMTK